MALSGGIFLSSQNCPGEKANPVRSGLFPFRVRATATARRFRGSHATEGFPCGHGCPAGCHRSGNGLAQLRVLPECCPFRRHPVSASGGRLCNRMCGILGRRNDVNTARNALARESGAKAPAAARARPLLAGRNPRLPGRGRHQCSENSCTQLKNRSGRARPVDPPPHSP